MADIKTLFDNAEGGALTYEQFQAAATAAGAKFTDLNEGKYISKHKHEDELSAKIKEIEALNSTITTRDTDLTNLKKQLEDAGTDAQKLEELNGQLTTLQNNYTEATKKYEEQLARQAYEFAVKEFASTKKFSSQAAKRDFTQSMIKENLKFKDNKILGAEDFVQAYTENNADAFVTEDPTPNPAGGSLPQFMGATPGGQPAPIDSNAFAEAFNFIGVRPMPQ